MTAAVPSRLAARRGRLDWRFLLPISAQPFNHLVLLGATADLARRVQASGLAQRVSTALPEAGSADAVAALSGANVAVRDLAECLRPGGALYYEVDRRGRGSLAVTPGRAQRQLRQAGLTPTGVYWAAPNFADCRRYVPLNAPEAMRWYLSALFVAGSPQHRLLEVALRAGLAVGAVPLLVPCFALTACAAAGAVAPSPAWLESGSRLMVITSGHDFGSRSVLLPFRPGDPRPRSVVKVSAHASLNANTAGEQAVLAELQAQLGRDLQRTVPRPLGEPAVGALTASVESSAPGQSLVASSGRWPARQPRQVADLQLMARWLSAFHTRLRNGAGVWDEAAYARYVGAPCAAYAGAFGLSPAEETLLAQTQARGRALLGKPLPLVWLHYDFGPWNLFRRGDALTVIDWETGRAGQDRRWGPGLYDLLYGVTYWHHVVARLHTEAAELEGQVRLFATPAATDYYVQAAHRVIGGYLAEQGLDPAFVPVMLVALWVEQALHRMARGRALEGAPVAVAAARAGNRPACYLGALAEHADTLGAGIGVVNA